MGEHGLAIYLIEVLAITLMPSIVLSSAKFYSLGIHQILVSTLPCLNILPQALLLFSLSPQEPQHDKQS